MVLSTNVGLDDVYNVATQITFCFIVYKQSTFKEYWHVWLLCLNIGEEIMRMLQIYVLLHHQTSTIVNASSYIYLRTCSYNNVVCALSWCNFCLKVAIISVSIIILSKADMTYFSPVLLYSSPSVVGDFMGFATHWLRNVAKEERFIITCITMSFSSKYFKSNVI